MKAREILESSEFRKCLDFHGHLCPGLSLGYKAAKAGLEHLGAARSGDEELVAIVETDACCADAVQVVTGCTFGKGNLIHKDLGKMAFTFLSRDTGQGVRVSLKPGAFSPDEEHLRLLEKVAGGSAGEAEKSRFEELHRKRSLDVLERPAEDLFSVTRTRQDLPEKARIDASVCCESCGEPVMASKTVQKNGKKLCLECSGT